MCKYLKEGSYYDDLYDLGTVEECIRVQEYWKKVKEGLTEEDKGISLALNLGLYCLNRGAVQEKKGSYPGMDGSRS